VRPKVAAYLLAKAGERERESEVLGEQRVRIEEHARGAGWDIAAVYDDTPSRSRAPGDRPGMAALLASLDGIDKVVVVSLDRLRPGTRAAVETVRRLREGNVDLVSLDEEFDTGDSTGRAAVSALRLAARWESRAQANQSWEPENLRKPGFAPATVIDVGAGQGTPRLYEAFPNAHHVLVEPLAEHREALEELVNRQGGEYVAAAAGAQEGSTTMTVDTRRLFFSSLLERRAAAPDRTALETREVPVVTLDALRGERGWDGPFGIKIDTEGYEDEVLRGAAEMLRETQFVLAEVVLNRPYEGGYSFAELVALLDRHGFRLCDILTAPKAMPSHEATYIDAIFRPAAPVA
jgi:FkbM family methyltransferase